MGVGALDRGWEMGNGKVMDGKVGPGGWVRNNA